MMLYSDETLVTIERHYEQQIAELRKQKTTILAVYQKDDTGVVHVLQVLDVLATRDGLIVKVA